MPGKPGRYCPHCGQVVTGARCICRVPVTTSTRDERPTSTQRGYGYAWQQYRSDWFDRHPNPLCACGCGSIVSRQWGNLDHEPPLSGPDDPRLFDDASIRPYVHSHHSRKTAMYDHHRAGGIKSLQPTSYKPCRLVSRTYPRNKGRGS